MRRLDTLKGDLENRYDWSPLAAFRTVDRFTDSFIDKFNLGRFFRNAGHFASDVEIQAIIRRFDMDADAKIDQTEFSEFLRNCRAPLVAPSRSQPPSEEYKAKPTDAPRNSSPLRPRNGVTSPVRQASPTPERNLTSPARSLRQELEAT